MKYGPHLAETKNHTEIASANEAVAWSLGSDTPGSCVISMCTWWVWNGRSDRWNIRTVTDSVSPIASVAPTWPIRQAPAGHQPSCRARRNVTTAPPANSGKIRYWAAKTISRSSGPNAPASPLTMLKIS
jgi:hypothetical protein